MSLLCWETSKAKSGSWRCLGDAGNASPLPWNLCPGIWDKKEGLRLPEESMESYNLNNLYNTYYIWRHDTIETNTHTDDHSWCAAIHCRYQKMHYYHKEYVFLVFLSCQLTQESLSNHLRQTTQPCLWTTCNCQRMATTHSAISRTRHAVGVVARQYLGESRWTPDSRGCRMLATLICSWKTFIQSSGGCRLEPGSFALLAACAFKGTYLGLVSEDSEQSIPQSILRLLCFNSPEKLCELLHPWGYMVLLDSFGAKL